MFRSTSITWAPARSSAFTAARPAKPAPTTITRGPPSAGRRRRALIASLLRSAPLSKATSPGRQTCPGRLPKVLPSRGLVQYDCRWPAGPPRAWFRGQRRSLEVPGSAVDHGQLGPGARGRGSPGRLGADLAADREQHRVLPGRGASPDAGQVHEVVRPGQWPARPEHPLGGDVIGPGLAQPAVVDAENGTLADPVQPGCGSGVDPGQDGPGLRVDPDERVSGNQVEP